MLSARTSFIVPQKGNGMANLLIVTEKPSVAKSIASALGVKENEKHEGYIEGFSDYFGIKVWVTWCLGHLVQMSYPEAYDPKYAKWRLEDLPILPEEFRYEVIQETEKQFRIVAELMNSVGESEQDKREKSTLSQGNKFLVPVESICCATDAGREGELIFRHVYKMSGCRKPFERLWISSMEDEAIREGFEHLVPSEMYDSLYRAALCREHSDWLVGMNGTRLFSVLYGRTLNVGRVMTPTLAMIVERDAAINAFVPQPFYVIRLEFEGFHAESARFTDKNEAEELLEKCRQIGHAEIMDISKKEHTVKAPLLYDLTSLQRDANRILGFTSQQTLDYAQSLYEKKLITYPRTDSRFLTDDMAGLVPDRASMLREFLQKDADEGMFIRNIINSAKVTDHHAIIPTGTVINADIEALPGGELSLLYLISNRFLAAIAKPHIYEETIISMMVDGEPFSCKAKHVIQEGWKVYERDTADAADDANANGATDHLHNLRTYDEPEIKDAGIREGRTTPPEHYTEDTLLSAMQNAGKEEMPEEVERKGIGTPATRAGTIEKLIRKGFIKRKGSGKKQSLIATDIGTALITVMPEELQSPSMTAEWEEKLLAIERGEYDADEFMGEIEQMVISLVKEYEPAKDAKVLMQPQNVIGKCPNCGGNVAELTKGWACQNRDCSFIIWKDNAFFNRIGKKMTKEIAVKLLEHRSVLVRNCKSQRTNKNYDAEVCLTVQPDGKANYHLEFPVSKKEKKKPKK